MSHLQESQSEKALFLCVCPERSARLGEADVVSGCSPVQWSQVCLQLWSEVHLSAADVKGIYPVQL